NEELRLGQVNPWWYITNPFVTIYHYVAEWNNPSRASFFLGGLWFLGGWAALTALLCLPWMLRQVRHFHSPERAAERMEHLREYLSEGERAGQRYSLSLPRQTPRGASGAVWGQRAGSSLEFKDYRDYQPGDDLRHIDWNAFARSDQLSVKLFREEIS